MSPANDPSGRVKPRLITPPGSIPSLMQERPVAQPPPLNYPPLGPVKDGSPGKGPGFALTDHQHPLQASGGAAQVWFEYTGRVVADDNAGILFTPHSPLDELILIDGTTAPQKIYDPSNHFQVFSTPAGTLFFIATRGMYLLYFSVQISLHDDGFAFNTGDFLLSTFNDVNMGFAPEGPQISASQLQTAGPGTPPGPLGFGISTTSIINVGTDLLDPGSGLVVQTGVIYGAVSAQSLGKTVWRASCLRLGDLPSDYPATVPPALPPT